ncbi:hypothetical protein MTBPR1_10405 [Candidatus Terasakiella magnetica]|uniref:Uncharacterized protein n=1 Tax=Candidatus Terasakiella magnetica TaxID=1867952 RepID=A0A1C3RD13_9PROT|nr:hypothetical protein MTBPR1_10405 [Candidatus Terasakiella magnetica]
MGFAGQQIVINNRFYGVVYRVHFAIHIIVYLELITNNQGMTVTYTYKSLGLIKEWRIPHQRQGVDRDHKGQPYRHSLYYRGSWT